MALYLQFPICMERCVIDHTRRYTFFSVASVTVDMAALILGELHTAASEVHVNNSRASRAASWPVIVHFTRY